MQSEKLKNVAELLEYGGGKFLVVENGEPSFVVLDIKEFKKINEIKQSSESALLKKINDDIEMWKEEKWDDKFDDEEEGFFDDKDEINDIVFEEVDNDEEKEAIIQSAMKKRREEPVGLEGIPF